jgi:SAM-dependent methyltransferase
VGAAQRRVLSDSVSASTSAAPEAVGESAASLTAGFSPIVRADIEEIQWCYHVRPSALRPELSSVLVPLRADLETCTFMQRQVEENSLVRSVKSMMVDVMLRFMSLTDANGLLSRGHMLVATALQVATLLGRAREGGFETGDEFPATLLDVGAGDGDVTDALCRGLRIEPSRVVATEVSRPMLRALSARGFTTAESFDDDAVAGRTFSFVSVMNVLDRTDSPLDLLARVRGAMHPHGLALVAVVAPFRPMVEDGGEKRPPRHPLLLPRTATRAGASLEDSANALFEHAFLPVVSVARVCVVVRITSSAGAASGGVFVAAVPLRRRWVTALLCPPRCILCS